MLLLPSFITNTLLVYLFLGVFDASHGELAHTSGRYDRPGKIAGSELTQGENPPRQIFRSSDVYIFNRCIFGVFD